MKIYAKNRNGLLQKFLGLHWHEGVAPIYFETRWGVHTFGLSYPILCLILNSDDVVVKSRVLKKSQLFIWDPRYKKVLEIPKPNRQISSVRVGDKIDLTITS